MIGSLGGLVKCIGRGESSEEMTKFLATPEGRKAKSTTTSSTSIVSDLTDDGEPFSSPPPKKVKTRSPDQKMEDMMDKFVENSTKLQDKEIEDEKREKALRKAELEEEKALRQAELEHRRKVDAANQKLKEDKLELERTNAATSQQNAANMANLLELLMKQHAELQKKNDA